MEFTLNFAEVLIASKCIVFVPFTFAKSKKLFEMRILLILNDHIETSKFSALIGLL